MSDLTIINYNGQRVLTTAQLAESYGTDGRIVSNNFNRNKERYTEGKHFIALRGDEKRVFLNRHQFDDSSKNAAVLYLWTEKGAWLHAKSLNTDEAWDAYEMLVDEYYNVREQLPQPPQSLELALQAALEHEREIKSIKSDVNYLKGSMRVDTLQQQEIQQAAKQSVIQALGGIDSIAYKEMSKKVFSSFWREFKQHFKVPRYGDIPKAKFEEAIRFIQLWRPSTSLQMEIDQYNSQMSFV
ncbi:ORF6C domain-containing protein [Halalkalibacterium halodurans]|uniref:ORF6C domain-containing protein n=1 Tax=Halalkalibacterium halodurans TaxID=86665 RepID=UPI002AA9820A|nr:ORF6C domain-containing protein [Halalkalibacterium halodurans]MDY7222104.1 ORF6C domain-containing protein [Halalkalibacterium halodurans]MDY7243877.1 ORF6C domain-containing protein [Halalkalibacterium halodurans]